ncbi:14739_t:CDS:2, partial [Funneliformis mosseae]
GATDLTLLRYINVHFERELPLVYILIPYSLNPDFRRKAIFPNLAFPVDNYVNFQENDRSGYRYSR